MQRIVASLAAAILAGKPDLEAMFERPVNETQVFNLRSGSSGNFKLQYNGEWTAAVLPETADAAAIETALENLGGITDVEVTGSGTGRDPWQVRITRADQDGNGNYYLLGVDNTSLMSEPVDAGDAAARTRPSISLSSPDNYQRVYYDVSAENVEIHGGGGSDTFICDDSMAALYVYGDSGNDNFLIGRVLKTKTVLVDGQATDVVDGPDGITPGVSFNGYFYGGSGDDYFEVNHNFGELQLFGESGDDTFFLKAQLQDSSDGSGTNVDEMAGGQITAGAGDDRNNVAEGDNDVLINYIENNRVEVFGGSGFATVVVAGTTLDDTFYIFTDSDGRQYLYGAGLKLENFDGIERLAVITGAGNDTVYLYGLDERLTLLVNLGSGDDRLVVGGPEETFQVTYPASNAVYTVQQQILTDVFQEETISYNDVVFQRRTMSTGEKQQAWREFYYRWVKSTTYLSDIPADLPEEVAAVLIDERHWNLLEANLAVALKLYAQGVEKARQAPVYGTTLGNVPSAYHDQINALEQALLDANNAYWTANTVKSWTTGALWWKETHYSSPLYAALLRGDHPQLPETVEFETLAGIVPSGGYNAGSRTLDQAFYQEYLHRWWPIP